MDNRTVAQRRLVGSGANVGKAMRVACFACAIGGPPKLILRLERPIEELVARGGRKELADLAGHRPQPVAHHPRRFRAWRRNTGMLADLARETPRKLTATCLYSPSSNT